MKQLIILIGNIGSGKTTLCNKLVNNGFYIVSSDALRYMIGNGNYIFDNKIEPEINISSCNIAENLMKKNVDIVIDEVNMTKKRRKPFIKMAKLFNYRLIAYNFKKIPKNVALNRRMKNSHGDTSRKIWGIVYDRFNKSFEKPTKKEGFDIIIKK